MKNIRLSIMSCSCLLALLASCGPNVDDPSSTNTSQQNQSTTSHSDQDGTSKIGKLKVSLKNTTIPEGSDFYDSAKPTVIFEENGKEPQDVTDWKLQTEYKIVDKNNTTLTYGAGDALPAGEYLAIIKYPLYSLTSYKNFTVQAVTVEKATEGRGYKKYSLDDLYPSRIASHSFLGALGSGKFPSAPNPGDQVAKPKMIVVPVDFSNASFLNYGNTGASTEAEADRIVKEKINAAYFETNRDKIGWESLKTYYYKSSYGRLDIQGEVTDVYHEPMTTDQFENLTNPAATVVTNALNWLKNEKGYNFSDYDYDHDGYIDGIELMYVTNKPDKTKENGKDCWWNYTSIVNQNLMGDNVGNVESPVGQRYFWSLYGFIANGYYTPDFDAHTIVHETGHMLGANDYYCYDRSSKGIAQMGPAGCVDMMDCNVGDHNAYSKMFYNWVAPRVIDGSSDNFEITIESFADTGDFLLVRESKEDPWNETPWDEYLIIQYYTPTGVNAMDSKGYKEWLQGGGNAYGHGGTYDVPGVQVFHVDSRNYETVGDLVKYMDNGIEKYRVTNTKNVYTDELNETDHRDIENLKYRSATKAAHENTPSYSAIVEGDTTIEVLVNDEKKTCSAYRELCAIPASGSSSFLGPNFSSNFGKSSNLFGDKTIDPTTEKNYYGGDTYSNYKMRGLFANDMKFNDGSTFDWTWSVTSHDDKTATLHFVRNK